MMKREREIEWRVMKGAIKTVMVGVVMMMMMMRRRRRKKKRTMIMMMLLTVTMTTRLTLIDHGDGGVVGCDLRFGVMFDGFGPVNGRVDGRFLSKSIFSLSFCQCLVTCPRSLDDRCHMPYDAIIPPVHSSSALPHAALPLRSLQILGDQTEASLRKAVVGTAFTVLVMMLVTWAAHKQWLAVTYWRYSMIY